jgi:hypothetical protein
MNWRALSIVAAGFLFCMFVQLLSGLAGAGWAIFGGAFSGVLFLLLMRFFEADIAAIWLRLALPGAASLAGVALGLPRRNGSPSVWLSPLAAVASAGIWILLQARSKRRCGLCSRRIGRSAVAFDCPRCQLLVCEQTCWDFEHQKCTLCEQNRVPVFSPDSRWWDRQTSARARHGRCQLCMESAEVVDLRCCRRCGRPQCRSCWDYSNGQCNRCQWVIEDLPEKLQPYVTRTKDRDKVGGTKDAKIPDLL